MKLGARNHTLKQNLRARTLRAEMSISEKVLWEQIRRKRLGFAFKRQVPVGPYILDFYCAQAALCVEVDGEQHGEAPWRDARRDAYLREMGIETLRIPSLDLYDVQTLGLSRWLGVIQEACSAGAARKGGSHPQPPPSSPRQAGGTRDGAQTSPIPDDEG